MRGASGRFWIPIGHGCGGAGAGRGDAVSEVSEAEVREWLEEQVAGAEGSGGGEELPLFLPLPDFMVPAEEV